MTETPIHLLGPSGVRYQELDPRLQKVIDEAVKRGLTFKITCGYRNPAAQLAAYNAGKSKAKPGQSAHNRKPARAFDFIPHPFKGWGDTGTKAERLACIQDFRRCAYAFKEAGKAVGVPVTWGRDWDDDGDETDQKLMDAPHMQLTNWSNIK